MKDLNYKMLLWLYRLGFCVAGTAFLFSALRIFIQGADLFFVSVGIGALLFVPIARGFIFALDSFQKKSYFLLIANLMTYGLVILSIFLKSGWL